MNINYSKPLAFIDDEIKKKSGVYRFLFGKNKYSIISSQLKNRSDSCIREWENTIIPMELVYIISPVIKAEFKWPNDKFLPFDPCNIIMCEHSSFIKKENVLSVIFNELEFNGCSIILSDEATKNIINKQLYDIYEGFLKDIASTIVNAPFRYTAKQNLI